MFANTVNRRTKTIISRPVSLALSIDVELESVLETASTSPTSSKSSFTTHSNDSAATLVNDILVMQIAKESKDYEPSISTPLEDQHPLLRQPAPLEDVHPLLRHQSPPVVVVTPPAPIVPRTRKADRSSQCSQISHSSRYSRSTSKDRERVRSTRRDNGRDRYSTMPLVLESYEA